MRKEKNVHKMLKAKENFGITLVALIITIVVLLILAVVSIGAIRDSDIIGHSKTAQSLYTEAQEKENVSLSVLQAHTVGSGKIIQLNLQDALDDYFGENETWLTDNASKNDSYFLIVVKSSGRQYRVYYNGKIETITEEYSLTNTPYQVNIEKEYDETENKVKVTITDNLYKEDGSLNYDILTIEDSIDIITAKQGLTLDSSKDKLEEFILKFAKKGLQASCNSYEALVQTYIDMGELSDGATKYDALNLLLKYAYDASYNNQTIQELASTNFDEVIRYRVIDGVKIEKYVGDGSDYWKIEENGTWEYGLKVEFKVNGETIFSKKAEKLLEVTEIIKYELAKEAHYECTIDGMSVYFGFSDKTDIFSLCYGSKNVMEMSIIGKYKFDELTGKILHNEGDNISIDVTLRVDKDGKLIMTNINDGEINTFTEKEGSIFTFYQPVNGFEDDSTSKYAGFISGIYRTESGKMCAFEMDDDSVGFEELGALWGKTRLSETDEGKEEFMTEYNMEIINNSEIKYKNETYNLLEDISEYF